MQVDNKRNLNAKWLMPVLIGTTLVAWLTASMCLVHLGVETEHGIVVVGLAKGAVSVRSEQCIVDPLVRPELWQDIQWIRQSSQRSRGFKFLKLPRNFRDWGLVLPTLRWREGMRGLDPGDEKLRYSSALKLPLWIPLGVLLIGSFSRIVGRRLAKVTECMNCRYDLTGNTSGICPECGTAIPEEQRARLSLPTESTDA
jgi:hypothetical protein